jgi:hypothetical protein
MVFRCELFSSEDAPSKIFQGNRYESALARKPVNYLPELATGLVFPSARDKRSEMNRSKGVENFLVMPTEH